MVSKPSPRKEPSERSRYSSMDEEDMSDFMYKSKNAEVDLMSPRNSQDPEGPLGKPLRELYSGLMEAQKWDGIKDPKGWYLSEKLDGVRAFWDGKSLWNKKLERKYALPSWFKMSFPSSPLDGELYMGRGTYQKLTNILKKLKTDDEEWNDIKYYVFDAPEATGPFNVRLQKMKDYFQTAASPYIILHKQDLCQGHEDLRKAIDRITEFGGEGLMLRDPKSTYEQKRSMTLLKIKPYHDEEAEVIGYENGKGKFEGKVGALKVRNKEGQEFTVGTGLPDSVRNHPPKIGSKITYKFTELTNTGVPKQPTFLRLYQEV
jgi:DNA ligase 1